MLECERSDKRRYQTLVGSITRVWELPKGTASRKQFARAAWAEGFETASKRDEPALGAELGWVEG